MREQNLSAYELAKSLEDFGVKTSQQAILKHLRGEADPRSAILGAYSAFFRIPVDFFFSPMPGTKED